MYRCCDHHCNTQHPYETPPYLLTRLIDEKQNKPMISGWAKEANGSINSIFEKPDVIRLYYMVKRPLQRKKLTRKEIFERDKFKCQYCGSNTKSLTFDHIIPRCKGGSLSWTNIVSACKTCNLHKAGKTPKEAGMKLINLPKEPKPNRYSFIYQETIKNSWIPFIPWGKKEYSYTNSKENFVSRQRK